MSWKDFERALKDERRAENRTLAELHRAICSGNPHVQDEHGNWLTNDEIYEKMLKGDTK